MEYIFTYPREDYDEGKLTFQDIQALVLMHESKELPRMKQNLEYYLGHHAIEKVEKDDNAPNNKPVCNHAKDIADISSGYFLGHPIVYRGMKKDNEQAVQDLSLKLKRAHAAEADQDHALNGAIFGKSYEYIYREEGEKNLLIKDISPMETFIVVDDTIEHRKLFGINYYKKKNDAKGQEDYKYTIMVATETEVRTYYSDSEDKYTSFEHNLGFVPIIEFRNDKYGIGDFEQVIGLIDAYNSLEADRVNDKDQFIDSILVIYGALLGSTDETTDEAHENLKKKKLLELDENAKAEYLTHTLDEGGAETLRKALKQDIYTLSHVPNLADENFAGNSSGVAMEYKLLGLEMKTETKESWYRKGLRERLQIFIHDLAINQKFLEESDVEITFSRGLPRNILELSQIMVNLDGKVSNKTLLSLLPFVEDPDIEFEALKNQEKLDSEQKMAMEGLTFNTPIAKTSDDKKKEKLDAEN